MTERDFDIVCYGATGFTGRQLAERLAAHADREHFRFAIAGRSQEKLDQLAAELGREATAPDGVIVADALDRPALQALAESTRVVASTAGPFARYGSDLVTACVESGSHYVDITGETPWVRGLIDEHHERAAADGTRIIPFCGFDSVPSDLGTLVAADRLHRETGRRCARVHAYHRAKGGINGGTVASMIHMQSEGRMDQFKDPFLLNPRDQRPESLSGHRDPVAAFYSREARAWAAPFFMGPINSRVVRRSHALLQGVSDPDDGLFEPEFLYQEYWKASGLFGAFEAGTMSTVQTMTQLSTGIPALSGLIERAAPAPGSGPSEKTMDSGFFSCDLYARSEDGEDTAHVRLSGPGDPGNRITVKCLSESALLLALEPDQLPSAHSGGVLTPASGLGLALVPRLERAGIEFSED